MINKKFISHMLVALIIPVFAFCEEIPSSFDYRKYAEVITHPTYVKKVVSFALGAIASSQMGTNQYFPVVDPTTDEFYQYTDHTQSNSTGMADIFAGVELNYQPQWSLQTGLDFAYTGYLSANGTLVQGADTASANSYSYNYQVWSEQLLLQNKLLYNYPVAYKNYTTTLHPYAALGLGMAINTATNYQTNVSQFVTFTPQYNSNTQSSFSYRAGLGLDVDITSYARLGLGYNYTYLGNMSFNNSTLDGVTYYYNLKRNNIYANEFLLQYTYLF